jgi:hypothetical protein
VVFLLLASPRAGVYPGQVLVVHDRTDKTISYGKLSPDPTFAAGRESLPVPVRIRCTFPAADRYSVQVWFFQERGSDVLKGELPFDVFHEGA